MSKTKYIIVAIVCLVAVGGVAGYIVWNSGGRDISSERADFQMAVGAFSAEFNSDNKAADQKYLNKVVEINGPLKKIIPGDSVMSLVFEEKNGYEVICEMLPKENEAAGKSVVGQQIKLKAFYVGFMEPDTDFGIPGDIKFKKGILVK